MTSGKFLTFGPEQPNPARKTCWIASNSANLRTQMGGDFLVGNECHSLKEIEAEVAQIKSDLDDILRAARARFGA
jgi:hypothetical protein